MASINLPTTPGARGVAVAAFAALALVGCTSEPERDEESGDLATSGDVDVFDVKVGDCLLGEIAEEGEEISSIEAAPCSDPHGDEVFASATVPDGDFPGQDAVNTQAEEECVAQFADFVGLAYEASVLEISYFTPTEESWDTGDREILCTVYDPEGDTTGTLQDANR